MKTPLLLLPAQGPAPAFSDPDVLCPQPPPASGGPLCLRVHFHEPFHRIIATLLKGWNCHLQFTGEKVKLGDMEPLARHLEVRSGAPGPGKDVPTAPEPAYSVVTPSLSRPWRGPSRKSLASVVPRTWLQFQLNRAARGGWHVPWPSLSSPVQSEGAEPAGHSS